MPPDRMQHSKVGNLSFAVFLIIEARRKGMQSKKGKKNNISMIHRRLYSFPDFVPLKKGRRNPWRSTILLWRGQGILQRRRYQEKNWAVV